MPKVIKDIDNRLQSCAMELFVKYGYLNVDMKMISEKTGIAVGTLYHYYKNKQQLYLSVLSESWEKTFIKLNDINASDCTANEKLIKLIFTLYYDIKERNGLGKVFFDNSVEELKTNGCFLELKEKLLSIVHNIILNMDIEVIECSPESITVRLTESLLVSIISLIELHPDNDADNIDFLKYLWEPKLLADHEHVRCLK